MEAAVDTGSGARDLLRLLLALSMGGACISPSPYPLHAWMPFVQ